MRRAIDRTVRAATSLCAALVVALLLAIAGFIAARGLPAMLGAGAPFGGSASLFYPLVGTLLLIVTAFAVAAPLAVAIALVHSVYLRSAGSRRRLGLVLYALNSVPSIVLGIFGFLLFCQRFGWGKSWLAGGIVLAFMILPTITVAVIEQIAALPRAQLEAAYGLGLSGQQVVWSVVVPQSLRGLVSGTLIGLSRAAGETAPIMFTAAVFAGAGWPQGVVESPVLALPYHIFVSAQDTLAPSAQGEIWGAALLLLVLTLALGLASLPLRRRTSREFDGG